MNKIYCTLKKPHGYLQTNFVQNRFFYNFLLQLLGYLELSLAPKEFSRNVKGSSVRRAERKKRRVGRRKFIYFGFLIEYFDIKKADNLCYRNT